MCLNQEGGSSKSWVVVAEVAHAATGLLPVCRYCHFAAVGLMGGMSGVAR